MNRTKNIVPRWAAICLILAAITGCSKNSISPSGGLDQPNGKQIAFSTKDSFTKAAVNSKEDLEKDGISFLVWGWFEGSSTGHVFEEKGTPVKYDSSIPAWTYENTRYWIKGVYNFAAVYPASVNASYAKSDGNLALTITDFDVTNQDDLLVAFNHGEDGNGINGVTPPEYVDLNFKHALTKVNLKISQNFSEETGDPENDYLVKKVTLSGVNKGGSYIVSPASTSAEEYNEEWTFSNNTATFEKAFETPIKLRDIVDEENTTAPLIVWEDALLLLPQKIATETVRIQIDYIYRLKDDDGSRDRERSIEAYIPATENLWKSGNQITYTISIASPTNIVFSTPTTEPWSNPQPGGTIII